MPDAAHATRTCRRCGESKPATASFFHRKGAGLQPVCKVCACEFSRAWHAEKAKDPAWREQRRVSTRVGYHANLDASRKRGRERVVNPCARRWTARKHNYGITREQYEAMYRAQGGVCAICGSLPLPGRDLDVDHDHQFGGVRGLLCNPCNSCLGKMKDSPDRLRLAADYLERFWAGLHAE